MLGKCGSGPSECTRPYCYCLGIGCIALCIGALLVLGLVVQVLWNALLPDIFHLGMISYVQALGLLVLARLLVGGFGHRHGHGHKFGHRHGGWCGWPRGGECGDWQHYAGWWEAEGKESFRKYAESKKAGKEAPPA